MSHSCSATKKNKKNSTAHVSGWKHPTRDPEVGFGNVETKLTATPGNRKENEMLILVLNSLKTKEIRLYYL